jgi:hypothetical protein
MQSSNDGAGLQTVGRTLTGGFGLALFTAVIMLIALFINSAYMGGLFATLILYFLLLVVFYSFYEFFRYTTSRELNSWNKQELQTKAKQVLDEFLHKGDSLAEMLAKEGISLDDEELVEKEENEAFKALDLGLSPKSIIENDIKEDDVKMEALAGMSGYKRVYSSLLLLSTLSIIVIIVSLV